MERRPQASSWQEVAGGGHGGTEGGALRVLVVEDHSGCREILKAVLEDEGIAVTAVGTGREAIAWARHQVFDVVLTDLGLPDVHGTVVIREVAATAQGRSRVLVITGAGDDEIAEARRAGAESVFPKPVDLDAVVGFLRASQAA